MLFLKHIESLALVASVSLHLSNFTILLLRYILVDVSNLIYAFGLVNI